MRQPSEKTQEPAKEPEYESGSSVSHELTFSGVKDPGVGMSEQQYKRIQHRIHTEVSRGSATTIWLALAFAFAGLATSAVLALWTLDPAVVSDTVKGRLQAGAVGASALALLCLVMHMSKWLKDRRLGHDICHEMDIYCHRETEEQRHWWQGLFGGGSV